MLVDAVSTIIVALPSLASPTVLLLFPAFLNLSTYDTPGCMGFFDLPHEPHEPAQPIVPRWLQWRVHLLIHHEIDSTALGRQAARICTLHLIQYHFRQIVPPSTIRIALCAKPRGGATE
jgi:hypothetical protein